ncbi:hypothetical protein L7F22_067973 [Adiantum nelumboides]|nr:hypothetical protein [Adiantum nelumboides]
MGPMAPSSRPTASSIKDLRSSSPSARVPLVRSSWQEADDGRLLRHQGAQEVGHDCQEPDHKRQGRTHDSHDADAVALCCQALLHLPERRVPLPRDGVPARWRLFVSGQESGRTV